MKLIQTQCAICHSYNNYQIIYRSNFTRENFNADIFSARRLPDRVHYQIVKCNEDGLVRSNPVLDEYNLSKLYQKSKFTYEDEINNLIGSYIRPIQTLLAHLSKKAYILEIGCGNGFMIEKLYKQGYKNVFGVEPSIDAVKKAPKIIQSQIKINILKRNLFPEATFDFIFFFQVFDHIFDPNEFLDICYYLLKKDGFILAFNHDVDSFSSKLLGEKSPIIDIEHTYLYTTKTITKIFKKHKFKVQKIYSPINIISLRHFLWLLPLPRTIKKNITRIKKTFVSDILDISFPIQLGNMCLIAQK